jgi:hypothetical protein
VVDTQLGKPGNKNWRITVTKVLVWLERNRDQILAEESWIQYFWNSDGSLI